MENIQMDPIKCDIDLDELNNGNDRRLVPTKPIAIKAVWKSSKIFESHSVTYIPSQPTDRHNFIFIAIFVQGIGLFLPWNLFINAETYFRDFKLNSINASDVSVEHQKNFLFYFGFVANLSSVIAMIFNITLPISSVLSLTRRITVSSTIQVIAIVLTIILAILDTSNWPKSFFCLTFSSIIILNIANGVHQNCIHGIAAFLPVSYSRILALGSNSGGFAICLVYLLSLIFTQNLRLSAIYYFVGSLIILLVCFDIYYTSSISRFYRYFKGKSKTYYYPENEGTKTLLFVETVDKRWKHYLNIFLIYFVSYSLYPLILINFTDDFPSYLPEKYFISISCHLLFNGSSTLGSLISIIFHSEKSYKKLWIFIIIRILFIPLYMTRDFLPESHKLYFIVNNYFIFIIANFCLGFTNGLFGSLAIMCAPKGLSQKHLVISGMISALMIMSGVMTGFLSSFLILLFIK